VYPVRNKFYKPFKYIEGTRFKEAKLSFPIDWALAELAASTIPELKWQYELGQWVLANRKSCYTSDFEARVFPNMHDYQHTGAAWLAANKRAILADKPGLGKTVQAIAAAETARHILRKPIRILVLCKNPFRQNWKNELWHWADREAMIIKAQGRVEALQEYLEYFGGYAIVGWGTFRVFPELSDVDWDVIIVDESHTIKNRKTKTFGLFRKLKAPYMYFLTATPHALNAAEIWTTLNCIDRPMFRSYWRFFNTFVRTVQAGDFPIVIGDKNLPVFARVVGRYMLQRTAEQCIDELPELRVEQLSVSMHPKQAKQYARMNTEMIAELEGMELTAPTPLAKFMRLRQLASTTATLWDSDYSGKLDAAVEFVKDNPVNIVIATQFRHTALSLLARLEGEAGLIIGGRDNTRVQEEFQAGKQRVVIMTIDAGGESLNLQKADVMLVLERPWSPAKREQLEGRVYRPADTKQTMTRIIYLYHPRTIDTIVARKDAFRQKLLVQHAIELLRYHQGRY
jgi:SNF2 family DNA or RNA helicase